MESSAHSVFFYPDKLLDLLLKFKTTSPDKVSEGQRKTYWAYSLKILTQFKNVLILTILCIYKVYYKVWPFYIALYLGTSSFTMHQIITKFLSSF